MDEDEKLGVVVKVVGDTPYALLHFDDALLLQLAKNNSVYFRQMATDIYTKMMQIAHEADQNYGKG